jgi:hypothetical protein
MDFVNIHHAIMGARPCIPPANLYFILSQGTNTRIHFESSPFPSFDKGGAVDGLSQI